MPPARLGRRFQVLGPTPGFVRLARPKRRAARISDELLDCGRFFDSCPHSRMAGQRDQRVRAGGTSDRCLSGYRFRRRHLRRDWCTCRGLVRAHWQPPASMLGADGVQRAQPALFAAADRQTCAIRGLPYRRVSTRMPSGRAAPGRLKPYAASESTGTEWQAAQGRTRPTARRNLLRCRACRCLGPRAKCSCARARTAGGPLLRSQSGVPTAPACRGAPAPVAAPSAVFMPSMVGPRSPGGHWWVWLGDRTQAPLGPRYCAFENPHRGLSPPPSCPEVYRGLKVEPAGRRSSGLVFQAEAFPAPQSPG